MQARLQLRLLGTFDARLDGVPLERFRSAKVRALLAYLGVEAGPVHLREALATLLWGEYPQHEAQQSLSQALTNLRKLLSPAASRSAAAVQPLLTITRQTVQLHPASDLLWVDVHAFDSLLEAAATRRAPPASDHHTPDLLAEALTLYQGPFLAGLSLPDSREFEEWLMLHREWRHQAAMLALEQVTGHYLAEGRTELVEHYARRQLTLEPWSESGHQALMFALALTGRRAAALQQYEVCRRVLAEEMGIEPSVEIESLALQIRDGATIHASIGCGPPPAPFVAREREMAQLDRALSLALAAQGRVIVVAGEAGTGKTALLDQFAKRAQGRHMRLVVAGGQCGAYAGLGDPLLPFREILEALTGKTQAGWLGGHEDPERTRRLLALSPQSVQALFAEGPELIGRLVSDESVAARAGSVVGQMGRTCLPETTMRDRTETPLQQGALFGQVTRVLQVIARRQPLVLLIDDLQWADAASLSLLFHMGQQLAGSRILVVGAYRPSEIASPAGPVLRQERGAERLEQAQDERHPLEAILYEFGRLWGDIRVDLDQADGRRFVNAFLDGEPNFLRDGFRDRLTRHTGGHALFTIELLRAFQERGDLIRDEEGRWVEGPDLRWEGLPPRVEAVIAERVRRLAPEGRRLLDAASVEGESFSAEVAAHAVGAEPSWAVQWLSGPLSGELRLVQAVGVQSMAARGPLLSRYRFAHALFQEYLYSRLNAVDRAHLHSKVGAALEGLFRDDEVALARASPQLAQHYEEANRLLEAARYRLEAGRWAARLVAYGEAIANFKRGLALLEGAGASRERLRLELGLCMAVGTPVMMQRGWQAPAYTQALERLSDLIQHPDLRDDPQRLTALTVLALSAGWSANPERSGRVGHQLLDLAQDGDQQTLSLAHWALGFSHWLRGEPAPAFEHLIRALALYDPEANRSLGGLVAADPGVMAQAMVGAVLWQLGYPDQARDYFRQAVAHAQALEQPSSVAFAHYIAAISTAVLGRDVAGALCHSRALQPLGRVSLVYGAWAEMLVGQAQAQGGQAGTGDTEPGRAQGVIRAMEAGSTLQAAGSGGGYGGLMVLQADVYARAGQREMGLEALDRAQAWIERTGMRAVEADVWRMRGELLLALTPFSTPASGRGRDAENCFQRALNIARRQQSRMLELRAAVRLARLRGSQGRRDEARELLAGIYGWFTEGFDTVDLREAKALLDELA